MCTEGWGGIEQMELVWVKETGKSGKLRNLPIQSGKRGAPLTHSGLSWGLAQEQRRTLCPPVASASSLVYRC